MLPYCEIMIEMLFVRRHPMLEDEIAELLHFLATGSARCEERFVTEFLPRWLSSKGDFSLPSNWTVQRYQNDFVESLQELFNRIAISAR